MDSLCRSDLRDGLKRIIMSFILFPSFPIVSAELQSMKFLGREALCLMDIYRIEEGATSVDFRDFGQHESLSFSSPF